jgi:hypothetical protein
MPGLRPCGQMLEGIQELINHAVACGSTVEGNEIPDDL